MNNSFLGNPETPREEVSEKLKNEETRTIRIIEAIRGLKDSKQWSTLKIEVFDTLVNVLEKELTDEAKKDSPDSLKLTKLSGELKWAERFSDLTKFENTYRQKLQNIRRTLHGNTE